jgi:hypothetical protein
MTEILTAKSILEDLLRHVPRPPSVNPLATPVGKWLFWVAVVALGWFVMVVVLAHIGVTRPWLAISAQVSVLMAAGIAILLPWTVLGRFLLTYLRHPERAALAPVMESFNAELDLIYQLVHTYEPHQLEYAHDRVTLLIGQIRTWTGIVIGALEKVGVLPLAVAGYLSLQKLRTDQTPLLFGLHVPVDGILAALVVFYLMAMYQHLVCLQLDRFSLVLKHAVQAKHREAAARPVSAMG